MAADASQGLLTPVRVVRSNKETVTAKAKEVETTASQTTIKRRLLSLPTLLDGIIWERAFNLETTLLIMLLCVPQLLPCGLRHVQWHRD